MNSESDFYCMTPEVYEENLEIFHETNFEPIEVPKEETIKVLTLNKVGEDKNFDLFDITSKSPIDFEVRRIKFIGLYCDPYS